MLILPDLTIGMPLGGRRDGVLLLRREAGCPDHMRNVRARGLLRQFGRSVRCAEIDKCVGAGQSRGCIAGERNVQPGAAAKFASVSPDTGVGCRHQRGGQREIFGLRDGRQQGASHPA